MIVLLMMAMVMKLTLEAHISPLCRHTYVNMSEAGEDRPSADHPETGEGEGRDRGGHGQVSVMHPRASNQLCM